MTTTTTNYTLPGGSIVKVYRYKLPTNYTYNEANTILITTYNNNSGTTISHPISNFISAGVPFTPSASTSNTILNQFTITIVSYPNSLNIADTASYLTAIVISESISDLSTICFNTNRTLANNSITKSININANKNGGTAIYMNIYPECEYTLSIYTQNQNATPAENTSATYIYKITNNVKPTYNITDSSTMISSTTLSLYKLKEGTTLYNNVYYTLPTITGTCQGTNNYGTSATTRDFNFTMSGANTGTVSSSTNGLPATNITSTGTKISLNYSLQDIYTVVYNTGYWTKMVYTITTSSLIASSAINTITPPSGNATSFYYDTAITPTFYTTPAPTISTTTFYVAGQLIRNGTINIASTVRLQNIGNYFYRGDFCTINGNNCLKGEIDNYATLANITDITVNKTITYILNITKPTFSV